MTDPTWADMVNRRTDNQPSAAYLDEAYRRFKLPIMVDCEADSDDDSFCICVSFHKNNAQTSAFAVNLKQAHEYYAEAVAELGGK